jgi:hypothetical protein
MSDLSECSIQVAVEFRLVNFDGQLDFVAL